ncbi:MAG: hypothetical protein LBT40_00135 [Deltaproteobacteria bacterium]|nr:hypothetical protein [Deltaproteobacteria bacterium]
MDFPDLSDLSDFPGCPCFTSSVDSSDFASEFPDSSDLARGIPNSADLAKGIPDSADLARGFPNSAGFRAVPSFCQDFSQALTLASACSYASLASGSSS